MSGQSRLAIVRNKPGHYTEDDDILHAEAGQIADRRAIARVLQQSTLKGFTFADLKGVQFPKRATLLARDETPILRAGQLAQIFAVRGVGKTWLSRTIALIMASGGSALGFHAPAACRVLYLDGEMASEDIQSRDRKLGDTLNLPWSPQLVTVARDWQDAFLPRIDSPEGQAAIEPLVAWADVVIVDNRSCLFDPEGEQDAIAWQPAQDWLLSLRRRGKAVILVHHSNRQGGARGLGRAEDALDLVIKLDYPEDYSRSQGARFILSYEKTRGIPGGAALDPFVAALTPDGWIAEEGEVHDPVERKLLAVVDRAYRDGKPIRTKTRAVSAAGGNKQSTMKAWDRLLLAGSVEPIPDGAGFRVAAENDQ